MSLHCGFLSPLLVACSCGVSLHRVCFHLVLESAHDDHLRGPSKTSGPVCQNKQELWYSLRPVTYSWQSSSDAGESASSKAASVLAHEILSSHDEILFDMAMVGDCSGGAEEGAKEGACPDWRHALSM